MQDVRGDNVESGDEKLGYEHGDEEGGAEDDFAEGAAEDGGPLTPEFLEVEGEIAEGGC